MVLTATHYVLLLDGQGGAQQAVISMSSTQLKKSRAWNSMMASLKMPGKRGLFTPPSFSHQYKLTTTPEKNRHGAWYSWSIENAGMVSADVFAQAVQFNEAIKIGGVKVAREEPVDHDSETGEVF